MPAYLIFCFHPYIVEFTGGMQDWKGWIDSLENARPINQGSTTTPDGYIWEIVRHSDMKVMETWKSSKYKDNPTTWYKINNCDD